MTGIEIATSTVPEPATFIVVLENLAMIGGVLLGFAAFLLLALCLPLKDEKVAMVGVALGFVAVAALVVGAFAGQRSHEYREGVEQAAAATIAELEERYDIDLAGSDIDLRTDKLQTLLVTDARTGAPVTLIASTSGERITLFAQDDTAPAREFRSDD